MSRLLAPFERRHELVELELDGERVLVLARWMRNTIRKVTMVVPVLMTSCQVSEKSKTGPVTAQTRTTPSAKAKAGTLPVKCVAREAKRSKTGAWSLLW